MDASDPGPIVTAEEPLDQPIPVDACDSGGFCWLRPAPRDLDLNAIWAFSKNDVWVFGSSGLALHWDGERFRDVETSTWDDLVAAWASSPKDLYVLGRGGSLLRWNGERFESLWRPRDDDGDERARAKPNALDAQRSPPFAKHRAVKKAFADELLEQDDPGPRFNDLWGFSDGELWVAGEIETAPAYKLIPHSTAALIRHFDGRKWESKVWENYSARTSVWGTSPDDVFAWSAQDIVSHYEGGSWSGVTSAPTPNDFRELHLRNLAPDYVALWQKRPEDSWIVRHRAAGDLVERFNHRSGRPRAGSRLARLTFLEGTVRDIRGTTPEDVWLVGKGGLLMHFDGVRWRGKLPVERAPAAEFWGAWAVAPNDVWFVGTGVLRFDGNAFNAGPRPPGAQPLRSVWGEKSDAVWATTDDAVYFFDGKAWAPVAMPEKWKWTRVRGVGSKIWITGDGSRLFVGDRRGFTPVELPLPLKGAHSLLLRGADDALLVGKAAYRWDSRGLARSEPELDALVQATPLYNMVSAPGGAVIYGQHQTEFLRLEGARIVARAESVSGSIDQWVSPDGSLFAACGRGMVSFESGAFRFTPLRAADSVVDVAGDAENVWVLGYHGTILRKRLRRP